MLIDFSGIIWFYSENESRLIPMNSKNAGGALRVKGDSILVNIDLAIAKLIHTGAYIYHEN